LTDYLIAGLGNPGSEHAGQRHNVGFWLINRLAKRYGIDLKAGRTGTTGKGRIAGAEVVLLKPRTYVNSSGDAIGPLLKKEGVAAENLIVAYDDLDLPEGRVRLRPKGGSGGHNGLKSIVSAVGSGDFGRVRIGIGRPKHQGVPSWDPEVVMRWVLGEPPKAAREVIDAAVERACDAIEAIITDGWERSMDRYNRVEDETNGAPENG
jgi:PTH1 family peptidyl-tRNA hydrolase